MQLKPATSAIWQGNVEGANATTGELSGIIFNFNGPHYPGFSVELSSPSDLSALQINPVLVDYISYPVGLSVLNFEDIYYLNPCKVATTANITLSGSQTIDGVEVGAGERVLVKDQSTQSQNGVYLASGGAWTREGTLTNGSYIKASEGTYGASRIAKTVLGVGFVLDTSPVVFTGFENNVKVIQRNTVYYLRFKNFGTNYRTYANVAIYGLFQAATTANITLSGSQTIDGVTVVYGNYVLVKNQTVLTENGPYVVQPGATPWVKLTTFESENLFYYTLAGTENGGKHFVQTIGGSNEFIHASVVLYETVADATDEVNPIIPFLPVAGIGLRLYWFTKTYSPIACIEMAAADAADIYCCPAPIEYLQTFPDHVEIIFGTYGSLAARTVVARLFDPTNTYVSTYNGATYSGVNGINFFHYEYDATISCSGVPRTNLRSSFWFRIAGFGGGLQAQIMRYELSTGASVCASSYAYYSDYMYYVWRSNEPYYYDVGPTAPFTFYQTLPHSWASYDWTVAPSTFSSGFIDPRQPELLSFDIQYGQTIPPTITCYLVDAVFKRTTVDIPSGDDIALGTIDVTLTYDAASSTYYGPVANYYNIPGRLSMPIGILPTVASGSQFLVNGINWKVNSSNQIYYEKYLSSGAMDNTITLFYSSYSDARKPTPATLNFYKTSSYSVYTETNGSLLRSDPTTQTSTP